MIPANPLDFIGKAVLVTGGGAGIGIGIGAAFVAAGVREMTTIDDSPNTAFRSQGATP